MSFTAEQKSQLAKLMATENLTVEHQKISTARFDPQNRILYLPIWQNMSGVMYDLLTGHEVGHALYTPAEGWHDAVTADNKGANYKNFLNVVEDARIEKKVKRKYPGLNNSFKNAYRELMARDFFRVANRDINKLPFIDRLNLFTKSQYTMTSIEFTAQESVYVRRIQEIETWEDVLKLTEEIYGYSKDEQEQMQEELIKSYGNNFGEETGDDFDDYEEMETEDEEYDSDNTPDDSDNNPDGEDDAEQSGSSKTLNREKDSNESFKDQFEPTCATDKAYRENENLLLDEKGKPYKYVNLPKPNLNKIITPANRVQELYTKEFNKMIAEGYFSNADAIKWVNEFKNKNEKFVGLLAKEFEMRKAAKAFSKSKLSDTGDIDINKLASYKFDDNIFRKVMLTPKGKKHGLILLLDKSGSMSNNMAGSIEQILVLTMFCRKVNIPFKVYGYGDDASTFLIDNGINYSYDKNYGEFSKTMNKCFSENLGEVDLGTVRMREYLNSSMSNSEYTKAIRNMILVKKSYEGVSRSNRGPVPRPETESLSNTPTTQAIVATAEIMKQFRQQNNLDLTSLIIVQDGDADRCGRYFVEKDQVVIKDDGQQVVEKVKVTKDFYYRHEYNLIVRDPKNQFEKKLPYDMELNTLMLDWFRKTTNSKVFGFYITPTTGHAKSAVRRYYEDDRNQSRNYYEQDMFIKEIMKKFKSEKYLSCKTTGYDDFYLVAGGDDLIIENDEIQVEGKVTTAKLKSAFMKFNKKKAINRVLVSRFIQGIAA